MKYIVVEHVAPVRGKIFCRSRFTACHLKGLLEDTLAGGM
jgi:hypothetical protein